MSRLLVVDIGNTTTKLGGWDGKSVRAVAVNSTHEAVALFDSVAQVMAATASGHDRRFDVAISSVVPEAEAAWLEWCDRGGCDAFVIHGDTPTPLVNRYRSPARLGPDRLATAVGAVGRLGAPVIVVSVGTAVVVDAMSPSKEYLGGAIWVGIPTGLAALAQQTVALPKVTGERPSSPIGGDTESSLRAGSVYGTASLIEGLASHMRAYIGKQAPLVLTGGDAELVSACLRVEHQFIPTLTLEGIALIWEHNRGRTDEDR